MFEVTLATFLLITIAGIATGIINGVIGGGSIISYLALVSSGVPPTLAASTNTVGVLTGNPSALIKPFQQKQIEFKAWLALAVATVVGTIAGGILLIALPDKIFETLVPLLLLVAGFSVWIQPTRRRKESKLLLPMLFCSGIYNGYFGPGQGILNISILFRGTTLQFSKLVVAKNYIITLSNLAVSILFVSTFKVEWIALPILWISVGLGGWFSQSISRRLNENALRLILTALSMVAAGYFIAH